MKSTPLHALIDAGTITFKLVVFRKDANPLSAIVLDEEVFVKLWEPEAGVITSEKANKAVEVLSAFHKKALQYGAVSPRLFCTEAFRTSANGPALLHAIQQETGLRPEVLTGKKEATLLARAAMHLANDHFKARITTMDIGGGSAEVAIIDPRANKVLLADSLPLGGSAIYHRLSLSDPLRTADVEQISNLVKREISKFQNMISTHRAFTLLGSAGVFESLVTIKHYPHLPASIAPNGWAEIGTTYLKGITEKAMQTTAPQRAKWEGLKPERAPYFAAALVMLHEIVRLAGIQRLLYSRAGLKEGLVLESSHQRE